MSKPTWHGALPWSSLRQLYRSLRRQYFAAPEPDRPAITTDVGLDELRATLGQRSWAANWEFSYYKRGEDLNLAHVVYWADHDHVDDDGEKIVWWQSHVRGWGREDGSVDLRAHWEPEPTAHPKAHLDGVGHDIERGMDNLRIALERGGVSFSPPK